MSDDDRAEKLAGRWGEDAGADAGEQASESNKMPSTSETTKSAEAPETNEASKTNRRDKSELTTREMHEQMVYLHPDFHRELDITFEELRLKFRRNSDRQIEKNKDFLHGLLELGLAELGDVDDQDIDELHAKLNL